MATEKQLAANRQNAQLSTGPTTLEGQAISAQNALKHGLFAEKTVVFGEDQAAYDQHRQALLAGLDPVRPLETLLAERIVAIAWRLLRTGRIQSEAFDFLNSSARQGKRKMWCFAFGYTMIQDFREESIIDRLLSHEHRIEQSLYKACLELERLQIRRTRRPITVQIGNSPDAATLVLRNEPNLDNFLTDQTLDKQPLTEIC